MIKAVIFDMYETLITHFQSPLYFGAQMAADSGIPEHKFQALWEPTESVGDGGSFDLEAAKSIGMKTVQAVWYLRDGTGQPCGRKADFEQIENPMDILKKI